MRGDGPAMKISPASVRKCSAVEQRCFAPSTVSFVPDPKSNSNSNSKGDSDSDSNSGSNSSSNSNSSGNG